MHFSIPFNLQKIIEFNCVFERFSASKITVYLKEQIFLC